MALRSHLNGKGQKDLTSITQVRLNNRRARSCEKTRNKENSGVARYFKTGSCKRNTCIMDKDQSVQIREMARNPSRQFAFDGTKTHRAWNRAATRGQVTGKGTYKKTDCGLNGSSPASKGLKGEIFVPEFTSSIKENENVPGWLLMQIQSGTRKKCRRTV